MNLPNKISLSRIILTPVMLILFLLDSVIPYGIGALSAAFVFILAAVTDGIDGHIARSRNLVTTLGKFLDSIADKILCAVALVMILAMQPVAVLYPFTVALVAIHIARDFIISALRQIAAASGKIVAADMSGKVKAVMEYIAIPVIIVSVALSNLCGIDPVYLYSVGFGFLCLATVLSVTSAIHYILVNKEVLRG